MYKDVRCFNALAKKIDIPTLILWGEKERMTHMDNAMPFHESKLVILKEIEDVPILKEHLMRLKVHQIGVSSLVQECSCFI